jgi:hypothetical protein
MKHHFVKKIIIVPLFLFTFFGQAIAQEAGDVQAEEKSLYPALLGGLFTNTVFHFTSRLFGADFSQTSLDSIKTNLTSTWIWDSDSFLFNHPGHPYQGGLYHAAARSNGFGFYESVVFNGLGSLTWELFGETDIPSLNDLIVTTSGGAVFGEMLHLLYLETRSVWIGGLVSPIDMLNNAVWGKHPARTNNLYYFSAMAGTGWIRSIKEDRQLLRNSETEPVLLNIYTGDIGGEVIYGNPFVQNSKTPYSQFEIKMQLGGSFRSLWLDWTILTDGYLVSFNPIYTGKNMLSTGLSLHYDLITGNNTNFASNALDWSLKWKHIFKNSSIEIKVHAGWTFFGSSQYYPLAEVDGIDLDLHESDNDYGIGGNTKFSFSMQNQKLGKLTVGTYGYLLYIIPWNKPDSRGLEVFTLSFLEYSYPITGNLSFFVSNSLYLKSGTSYRKVNVIEAASRIILGIQWTFLEKHKE